MSAEKMKTEETPLSKGMEASEPPRKLHITETPMTWSNWYKHINWLNVTFIMFLPIFGLVQTIWVPLQLKTAIWTLTYYAMTGLGITAGKFPVLWLQSMISWSGIY